MTVAKVKSRSFIENMAYSYLIRLTVLPARQGEDLHLLSDAEVKTIRGEVRYTLFWAAVFGVLGVLALYLPQAYYPDLFPDYPLPLLFTSGTYPVPFVSAVYGIILVYIELYALMAINIRAVYKIAEVCGFPDKSDPDHDKHLEALMRVGLEKEDRAGQMYGINPLQGASRINLFLFLIISRLKATISNYVAKILVRRFVGRYALRMMIDIMVGMPVYAFWNAYASYVVIQETKIRIMAPNLIKECCRLLRSRYSNNPVFREMIYDTLQYVAMSKRRYHNNHFLLAKTILTDFDIPVKDMHELANDYITRLKKLDHETKEGIVQLLIMGFIIDGNLSPKESRTIDRLYKDGVIAYNSGMVKKWIRSFVKGKGLDELFTLKTN